MMANKPHMSPFAFVGCRAVQKDEVIPVSLASGVVRRPAPSAGLLIEMAEGYCFVSDDQLANDGYWLVG